MPRRLRATSLLLVVVAFATLAQPALADAGVGYDLILSGYLATDPGDVSA